MTKIFVGLALQNFTLKTKRQYDEENLLLLIAKGNEAAFAKLFDKYRPVIYTSVLRLSGSPSIAEEIVQDVFLKAWMNRQDLPAIKNIGGWLYTVAGRLTYNALKQQQSQKVNLQNLDDIQIAEPAEDPYHSTETLLSDEKFAVRLQKAIGSLPQKQKEVFVLIRQKGLKRNQVAEIMNVSPETVKSNLNEAMKKIRAFIQANPALWIISLNFF